MEIENLKDLKEALCRVPDDVLRNFGIGVTDDGIALSTSHGEDESAMSGYFSSMIKRYPTLKDVGELISNIILVEQKEDYEMFDGYISNKNYTPNNE